MKSRNWMRSEILLSKNLPSRILVEMDSAIALASILELVPVVFLTRRPSAFRKSIHHVLPRRNVLIGTSFGFPSVIILGQRLKIVQPNFTQRHAVAARPIPRWTLA